MYGDTSPHDVSAVRLRFQSSGVWMVASETLRRLDGRLGGC